MVDVTGSVVQHMQDGFTAVTGVAQINTVTIGGTFEVGDRFTITLGEGAGRERYGAGGQPVGPGKFSLSFKAKIYALSGSEMYFSAIDEPMQWNTLDVGAGFINMANQAAGAEDLISLATYFDRIAVFSRRAVQVWFVDADADSNTQLQVLNNTGALAPKAVSSFGDTDVFYLSDSGVRSLRARDSSNSAHVSDVGNSIDTLVKTQIDALSAAELAKAVSVVEATDGRYMLALKDTIFVFSFFPASKISAWSTYTPGFDVDEMVAQNDDVWVRSGDTIYRLGGDDGNTFDSSTVTVILPFMDASDPATHKTFLGIDAALEGTWTVSQALDPEAPNTFETVAVISEITYADGRVPVAGRSSHGALKFVSAAAGEQKISTVAIHYQKDDSG